MTELTGNITISRRLAGHKYWHREPFSSGQAWVDLLMLANTQPADIYLNQEPVHLERGQVAHAIHNLADRWRRSRPWATKILHDMQEDGMLRMESNRRRTIITILNYDAFNLDITTDLTSGMSSGITTDLTSEFTQRREKGVGEGRKEKEGGARPAPNSAVGAEVPDDAEVGAFCAEWPGDLSRGLQGPIPPLWWTGWLAAKVSQDTFPRNWRRALVLAFTSDWLNGHPKARPTGSHTGRPNEPENQKNGAGMSPAQARLVWGRELAELEAEMNARHSLDQPPLDGEVARAKKLREKIGGLAQ